MKILTSFRKPEFLDFASEPWRKLKVHKAILQVELEEQKSIYGEWKKPQTLGKTDIPSSSKGDK